MYCGNSGCKVSEDDVVCLNCGSRIETDDYGRDPSYEQNKDVETQQQDPAIRVKAARKREPAMFIYPIMGGAIVGLIAIVIWGGLQLNQLNNNTESQVDSSSSKARLSLAVEKEESVIQDEVDLSAVTVSPTATPTPSPTQTPVEVSDNSRDYVFSSSSSSSLARDEIEALSGYDMYLARNEISARHGRKFVNKDLQHAAVLW